MLKGKKTYIAAIAIGLLTAAEAMGFVTPEMFQSLLGVLAGFGLVAARVGSVKK